MCTEQTPILLEDSAPNWQAESHSNDIARMRGKENATIVAETPEFGTLFSKSAKKIPGRRDTVAGLKHEFEMLDRLKHTGVTPEPLLFKSNPEATEGHLLMNTVPGSSLESRYQPTDFERQNFDQMMLASQQAMQKVHGEGIFVVDVNSGTFLLDENEQNQTIQTKIVDFELAAEAAQFDDQAVQDNLRTFYENRDIGLRLYLQQHDQITPEVAKKVEQYLTAKAVTEFFVGPDFAQTIDLSELPVDLQAQYSQQLEALKPEIEAVVQADLAKDFELRQSRGETMYSSLEEFLADTYDGNLQTRINQAMINITLPILLERNGVSADPAMIDHLQKTLSPDVSQRPIT